MRITKRFVGNIPVSLITAADATSTLEWTQWTLSSDDLRRCCDGYGQPHSRTLSHSRCQISSQIQLATKSEFIAHTFLRFCYSKTISDVLHIHVLIFYEISDSRHGLGLQTHAVRARKKCRPTVHKFPIRPRDIKMITHVATVAMSMSAVMMSRLRSLVTKSIRAFCTRSAPVDMYAINQTHTNLDTLVCD